MNVRPWLAPIEPRVSDAATDAAELQARIDLVASGGARAAVLGVSDGLVTNLSLILALAGADAATTSVRLAAFASLIAGAVSMAAGEWISVRSQVELYQGALDQIRALVSRNPGLMLNEVARRLEAAGFARETAHAASTELPLDEPRFLRFSSRLVFGVDEDQVGSPWVAAGSSFALFATGDWYRLCRGWSRAAPWRHGCPSRAPPSSACSSAPSCPDRAVAVPRVAHSDRAPSWRSPQPPLLRSASGSGAPSGTRRLSCGKSAWAVVACRPRRPCGTGKIAAGRAGFVR